MVKNNISNQNKHVYRVDKFIVPAESRFEFISRVEMTHNMLKTLPGFVQELILDQASGPGEFNFVTIVEWESAASIDYAKSEIVAMQQQAGFNSQELFHRLGIKADLANYQKIEFNLIK